MAKQVIFSLPASSTKRSLRVLISLTAILCLSIVILMDTFPVHAATLVIVQFNSLGNSQSATALFRGQPLDNVNTCLTAKGASLAGNVTGSGEFSVDFYSTSNCSGPRTHFSRFSAPDGSPPGGTVTCNSDTDCQFASNQNGVQRVVA